MSLANKSVYPIITGIEKYTNGAGYDVQGLDGLTFREALIVSLASNPVMIKQDNRIVDKTDKMITKELMLFPEESAKMIVLQADAIIKELEK
jgi:hypothetical protein